MLPRASIVPEGYRHSGPDLPISPGLRCGKLFLVSGQFALEGEARGPGSGDLEQQAQIATDRVVAVLAAAGLEPGDLVQLRVFYVSRGDVDEAGLAEAIAGRIGRLNGPGPALTMAPVEALALPGVLIEIEAIAMRGENGEALPRAAAWDPSAMSPPPPFSHALRVGEMIFTSGVTAQGRNGGVAAKGNLLEQSRIVLSRLDGLLRQLGADLQDVVKTNLFNAEPGTKDEWRAPALLRASHYREPGPCATGLSVRRLWPEGVMLKNDVVAMRGLDGSRLPRQHVWPRDHWDWTVHLPYRHGLRCGDLVFMGGQVPLSPKAAVMHEGDLMAQTRMSMEYIGRILTDLGLGFENIVRVNSFYVGAASSETLASHARECLSRFGTSRPAATLVTMPYLAYESMLTEIDVIAMA